MKKIDFIKMGFKNLWRRKLRTILTVMGVVVGTFSIVIMVSLGIGMTEGYKEQLAQWGSLTKITVERYNYMFDESSGRGASSESKLDDTLIEKIKMIDHVKAVSPVMQADLGLKCGKYIAYLYVTGIDPETMQYFDFPNVVSGEGLTESNSTGIIFGKESVYFYDPKGNGSWGNQPEIDLATANIKYTIDDVWGEKTPKYEKLKVAGIFEETNGEYNYSAYANIDFVKDIYNKKQKAAGKKVSAKDFSYNSLWVSVDDVNYVYEVQEKIKGMGYGSYSMGDSLEEVKQTSKMLQLVLGGIGAVSLFVSAIGIANTMVMSIYERTREIGIMKVLGCLVTDIRKIFLFEASLIGFCGGMLGIGLSYLVSVILNHYAPEIGSMIGFEGATTISIIPPYLAALAVVFAMLIGIVSGLYPARRATKIKALDAIRSE